MKDEHRNDVTAKTIAGLIVVKMAADDPFSIRRDQDVWIGR